MDLKIYQRQMWLTLKKYLSLVSAKKEDAESNKEINKEIGNLLKKIVSINENQKSVLSILRRQQKPSLLTNEDETSDKGVNTPGERLKCSQLERLDASLQSLKVDDEDYVDRDSKIDIANDDNEWNSADDRNNETPEDIHDLITTEEFMHSIGLLTGRECNDVVEKRRERHKRNGHSHIFCLSIWEKQETKRKRRDWLVSGSPPQLRRKVRPNSEPSSRQPSRGASPIEGSSSPSSSLSPPSPASPVLSVNHIASVEEICPTCKQKGANIQCDGCGVFYHMACVDYFEDRNSFSDWICLKCEQLGLRTSSYTDPLHHKSSKGNEKRQKFLRR